MPSVEFSEQEVQSLLQVLMGSGPWNVVHPLIMKIGGQMQGQQAGRQQSPQVMRGNSDGSHSDAERGAGQILGQAGGPA